MLQCTRTGNTYILNQQVEGGDNDQVVSQTPISRTIVLNGVPISVFCGPAAAPYPLAVDVGAASGGGPDLATQASTSTGSSGSGATWLFVAGGAAVLLVIGQLVIGRRVGRSNSATD